MASETRREIWVHSSLGRSGLKRCILSLRKWKANPMSRIAKLFVIVLSCYTVSFLSLESFLLIFFANYFGGERTLGRIFFNV